MKKYYSLAFSFLLLLTLSCGGSKEPEVKNTKPQETTEVPKGPIADREWSYSYNELLDGHQYKIDIHRYSNPELPLLKDELGQEYYDNSAEVNIQRDGKHFYSKTFTKDAFWNFLSDTDKSGSMLQGIAFDKSDAEGLHFGAQIGLPDGEGGPAFIVTVSKQGIMSIVKDHNQDTQGEGFVLN
ncbi:MAG: DUF4738 domain-containing protein [Bacteroidaceae bacterium]|nr:DUF4738 domain-containing protein [Bacteroidaceae bacterium]